MSDTPDQIKSAQPTPEQLLKLLDLQIAAKRSRRQGSPARRATILAAAVLLIIAGTLIALLILQQMIADLPQTQRTDEKPSQAHHSQ